MKNIIKITDFDAPELDIYARMSEGQLLNRHEPEKGIFIAESPKVIERALESGCVPISILIEEKHIETQGKSIIEKCGDINIFTAEFDVLTKLTGFKLTRGMLCAMRRPKPLNPFEMCKGLKRIAILEDVMNPTNVGAIFRCAAALNIEAILLTSSCSNPLYRRAIRVSMGNVFLIKWSILDEESWPENGIYKLHEMGFKVAALALNDESLSIEDKRLLNEEKLAIVLGTEGEGLRESTIENCDYTVKIPMSNGVDSLNVAAASAIAFWQLEAKKE